MSQECVELYSREFSYMHALKILDLQLIARESPDNVTRLLRLVPTIELLKYCLVPHHQHGRHASKELIDIFVPLKAGAHEAILIPLNRFTCRCDIKTN